MHIVHAAYSEEGDMDSLLVVGIFFQVAGEMDNEFLETIRFEQAPTSATTDTGTSIPADVDLNYFADILDGEFWRYKGSLTTPACSEIVEWHVMKAAATMSRSQFAYFQSIFPDPSNVRQFSPFQQHTTCVSRSIDPCNLLMGDTFLTRRWPSVWVKPALKALTFAVLVLAVSMVFAPGNLARMATSLVWTLWANRAVNASHQANGARARQVNGVRAMASTSHQSTSSRMRLSSRQMV